jgi:uncharacterized linocin/CFP29 family protein
MMSSLLDSHGVQVDSGKRFLSASDGRWAGERIMEAIDRGEAITPGLLRTNAVLRRNEWEFFDTQVMEEAVIRYRGVSDLIAAGLFKNIPNAMGRTIYSYENVGDMNPAVVSLDGMAESENDTIERGAGSLPLPITHKDFNINLRYLAASRNNGEGLDATMARVSARKVTEETERMLFVGGKVFGGLPIYGYTTHPNRNTGSFGTNGAWSQAAKTGANMLADLTTAMAGLEADLFYGPYVAYISRDSNMNLQKDYQAGVTQTIRQRLLQTDGLADIRVGDMLPANTMVLVQMTEDVVRMLLGEGIQTVQWDINGGMAVKFKVFQIAVPHIRATSTGKSGIFHMS